VEVLDEDDDMASLSGVGTDLEGFTAEVEIDLARIDPDEVGGGMSFFRRELRAEVDVNVSLGSSSSLIVP
jgi:hypothetical protein